MKTPDQLRDQLATAQQREAVAIASWNEKQNRALREGQRVVEWHDRAMKAEADLAALEQCHDDNCRAVVQLAEELAKERALLDSGQILLTVAGERVWLCGVDLRAAIDAGMKEGAK